MKIKAVTIDFWNTLFDSSNGFNRNAARQHVFAHEIANLNINISKDEFQWAIQASWEFFNNIWMNEQRTPETYETIEYLWNFLKLPHKPESIERVAKSFAESIVDYPPNIMDGVIDTLEVLKGENYKIGLISDTGFTPGKILKIVMKNADVLNYFDAFSFSDETGVSKPNSKAYTTILDEFEIIPAEALHIGDIEKTDIKGAKDIGMKAIRFSGDKNEILNKDNPIETIADGEIFSWTEFIPKLKEIEMNS